MPQLDVSTYASQIFWLLICFFGLMFIMSRFIIPKVAETRQQRQNKIDSYLQKAEEIKIQTENALKRYEDALSEATKNANISLQNTKDELDNIISSKQEELEHKLQLQIKESEAEINANKNQALQEIKTISASLAMDILQKLDITNIKKTDITTIINREAE